MGVSIDIEMGAQREALNLRTQGEVTLTTSSQALASMSKPVGASSLPPYPPTIATSTGITLVSYEFFHNIVNSQRFTDEQFCVVETKVATL